MAYFRGPRIITDNLAVYLDAANIKSYPTTGTTFNNLIDSENNGTLVNGPTFNTGNLGNIVFDGVNDYVSLNGALSSNQFSNTSPWSISISFKVLSFTNTLFPGILIKGVSTTSGVLLFFTNEGLGDVNTGRIIWKHNALSTNFGIIGLNDIYTITITYSGSGNVKLYLDGVFVSDGTGMASVDTTSLLQLGVGDEYSNTRLYCFSKYNKALSATEVLQNYNSINARFFN